MASAQTTAGDAAASVSASTPLMATVTTSAKAVAVAVAVAASSTRAARTRDQPSSGSSVETSPKLFIVCGRGRTTDDLRRMFSACGAIRHLHVATDRSHKSRGFAFLQYEDPGAAGKAIQRFDHMKLDDGHVLKVTLAKEKTSTVAEQTVAAPGKLKRNQQTQEAELDEAKGHELLAAGGKLPGKRQRPSPPSAAPPRLASNASQRSTWAVTHPIGRDSVKMEERPSAIEVEVASLMELMLLRIEKLHGASPSTTTGHVGTGGVTAKRKAQSDAGKTRKSETAADALMSKINSVRLDSEPVISKSQRTSTTQTTATRHTQREFRIRQRQVSIDESDSSVDDGSDASNGRRKRSNTESEPPTETTSRRKLSDLSDLSLSPAGISSPTSAKKRCNRRPAHRQLRSNNSRPVPRLSYPPLPSPRRVVPSARLFFTSTCKFTSQELYAMFSAYDGFVSVQSVRSFGRVKTMAYVQYSAAAAATAVLASFAEEETDGGSETVKLTYAADSATSLPPPFRVPIVSPSTASMAGESTSSSIASLSFECPQTLVSPERRWVMILYDRGLSNEAISSLLSRREGMEFIDIKMYKSTGESQGVAFTRFETEFLADAAARDLHAMEYPPGTRNFLQAMVIADPGLFSTSHTTGPMPPASESSSSRPPTGEDGELGFVEARFADLMSGRDYLPYPPSQSIDDGNEVTDRPGPHGYVSQNVPADPAPHTCHGHGGYQPYPPPSHFGEQAFGPYQAAHGGYGPPWGYDASQGYSPWASPYYQPPSPSPPHTGYFSWIDPLNAASGCTGTAHSPHDPTSVCVSSSRPLELSSLIKHIESCDGVVGFFKEERNGIAYVVDFTEPRFAAEAARKLDGLMCSGSKLRVTLASGHQVPSSRRKRQRVDPRHRK